MVCVCVIAYVVCLILMVTYGLILLLIFPMDQIATQDPMGVTVAGPLCWWSISHFIFYFILGLLCWRHWMWILAIGILWELFEYGVGVVLYSNSLVTQTKHPGKHYYDRWMTGNPWDIVMNVLGYLSGVLLAKLVMGGSMHTAKHRVDINMTVIAN